MIQIIAIALMLAASLAYAAGPGFNGRLAPVCASLGRSLLASGTCLALWVLLKGDSTIGRSIGLASSILLATAAIWIHRPIVEILSTPFAALLNLISGCFSIGPIVDHTFTLAIATPISLVLVLAMLRGISWLERACPPVRILPRPMSTY